MNTTCTYEYVQNNNRHCIEGEKLSIVLLGRNRSTHLLLDEHHHFVVARIEFARQEVEQTLLTLALVDQLESLLHVVAGHLGPVL